MAKETKTQQFHLTVATACVVMASVIGATWWVRDYVDDLRSESAAQLSELRAEIVALELKMEKASVGRWTWWMADHYNDGLKDAIRAVHPTIDWPSPRSIKKEAAALGEGGIN